MDDEIKDALRLAKRSRPLKFEDYSSADDGALDAARQYKDGGRWVGKEWVDEDGITHKRETPPQEAGITTPRSKASKTTPKVLIPPEEYRKGNIGPGAYALRRGGRAKFADGGTPTGPLVGTNPAIATPTATPEVNPYQNYVNSLYKNVMGREADTAGQQYWTDQLSSGAQKTQDVLDQFAASKEFQNLYSSNPNQAVSNLYQTALGRAPEQAGLDYWTQQAKGGYNSQNPLAASQLLDQFQTANEYQLRDRVLNDYIDYTGQAPGDEQYASAANYYLPKLSDKTLNIDQAGEAISQQYYIQNYWKDLTGKDLTTEQKQELSEAINNKKYSVGDIASSMEASPDAISYNNSQLLEDTFAGYGLDPTPEQTAQFLSELNSGKKTLDQADTEIGNLPGAGMGEVIQPYDVAGKGVSKKGFPSTPARLEKFLAGVPPEVVEAGKKLLIKEMDEQGITYPPQARDVIAANVIGETGFGLAPEKSYQGTSNSRIKKLFSAAKKLTNEELNELKKDDRSFFNKVYENVNGNEGGEDGYNFRGRGAVQLTGKANYLKYGELAGLGDALVKNPDLVNDPNIGTKVSVAFMKDKLKHGKGKTAFDRITKGVNAHGPTVSKKRTIFKSLAKDSPFGSVEFMPETGPTTPAGEKPPTTPEFKPPGPSSDAGTGATGIGVGGTAGGVSGGTGVGGIAGGGISGGVGGVGNTGGGTADGSADAGSTGQTGVYLGPMTSVTTGQVLVPGDAGWTADASGVYHNYADYAWISSGYNPWGEGWIDNIDNAKNGGRITNERVKRGLKVANRAVGGSAVTDEIKDALRLAKRSRPLKFEEYSSRDNWPPERWAKAREHRQNTRTPPSTATELTPRGTRPPTTPTYAIPPEDYLRGSMGEGEYAMARGGSVARHGYALGGNPTDPVAGTNPATATTAVSPYQNYVNSLYKNVMGREADAAGQQYWTDQLNSGAQTTQNVLDQFAGSQEFQNLYGTNPNQTVSNLYQTALGRAPEQAGLDYWTQQAKGGYNSQNPLSSGQLLDQFQTAQEYQTRDRVLNDYIKYTGEAPGAEQYASAAQAIAGGKTLNDVSRGISSSPKANANLVETAYKDILGRPPEPEAVNYWTNQLNKGTLDEAGFLDGLAKSSEGVNWANTTAVNDMYKEFYGRDPDKTDINKYGPYNDYLSKLAEGTLTMDQVRQVISQDPEAKSYEDSQLVKNMFGDLTGRTPPQYIMDDYTSKFAAGTMDFDKLFDTINATPEAQEYTRLLKEGVPQRKAGEQAEIKINKDIFSKALDEAGITDPAVRNIMASQAEAESRFLNTPERSFSTTKDNNYLKGLFPVLKGMSNGEINELKKSDRDFFNKVYGDKNGNKGGDDGYNYRGRGAIQLTGRANYQKYGGAAGLGDALVKNPDLLFDPKVAAKVSIKFMEDKNKHHPGATPFDRITRGVNSTPEAVAKKRAAYGKISREKEFSIPGAIEPPGQPGPATPDPDVNGGATFKPGDQSSITRPPIYLGVALAGQGAGGNVGANSGGSGFQGVQPLPGFQDLNKPAGQIFTGTPSTVPNMPNYGDPTNYLALQIAAQNNFNSNPGANPILGITTPSFGSAVDFNADIAGSLGLTPTNIGGVGGGFNPAGATGTTGTGSPIGNWFTAPVYATPSYVAPSYGGGSWGTGYGSGYSGGGYSGYGGTGVGSGGFSVGFMNKGGAVWDKSRPKSLGKPKHLSSKQKSSAKAAAKAAGRPYPNLVDNMRAAQKSHGGCLNKALNLTRRLLEE